MSRAGTSLYVRSQEDQRQRWHEAAEQAGKSFSDWVRDTLNAAAGYTPGGHARVPTSDQAKAEARRILAKHQSKSVLDLPPIPVPTDPGCPHPKDRREPKPYGTICGVCGNLIR